MTTFPCREGFIPVRGGRVWYQVIGAGDAIPLLTLHGGPGFPHDYLEPLAELADERPVIFYDQLGCGRSDRPEDESLWHMARFVEELGQVRQALGLARVHLLGQSCGSQLAIDYALLQPPGLVSLNLAGPVASVPRVMEDAYSLVTLLPPEVQATLRQHIAAGTTDSAEYQQAVETFNVRHLCQVQPIPDSLLRAAGGMGVQVFRTMWGPTDLVCTGNLKDYDRTERLKEITVPTLFTCGRDDICTPAATAWYHELMPGSEMVVFEQSSHSPQLEEPELFLQVVRDFLHRVEQG